MLYLVIAAVVVTETEHYCVLLAKANIQDPIESSETRQSTLVEYCKAPEMIEEEHVQRVQSKLEMKPQNIMSAKLPVSSRLPSSVYRHRSTLSHLCVLFLSSFLLLQVRILLHHGPLPWILGSRRWHKSLPSCIHC